MSRASKSWRAPRARGLVRGALVALLAALIVGGWFLRASTPATPPDQGSAALVRIAQAFDDDYAANRDGAVWDLFDPASQAIISRAAYIERHARCSTAPGAATVLGARQAGRGWWHVTYRIDQVTLVDTWHRVAGRWRFSLWRSNPGAVRLYRMPLRAYLRALGCAR